MNALSIILPPLSALYRAATQVRLALYRRGTLPITRLDAFVISVGNITTGVTGKTPLVERLGQILFNEGRKICILTRGYGRSDASKRIMVSDGQKIMATPEEAGD